MGHRRTVCVPSRKVATAPCGLERKVDSQNSMGAERKSLRIPHCPAAACFLSRLMSQGPSGLEPTRVRPALLVVKSKTLEIRPETQLARLIFRKQEGLFSLLSRERSWNVEPNKIMQSRLSLFYQHL